ncbi:pilin [Amycolatopsis sp. NPDC051061]|uniref:pilin n=1 Tax=Amycolatopsis sp. NPDC051061 TaxID=3155042 RepID=UPI003444955B
MPATRRRRHRHAATLLVLTAVAVPVLLGGSTAWAETVTTVALAQTVDQVLTNIRNWIMGILAGIALVFLTIGGVRYLMAGGNPGEVERAKDSFKASGVGFGLAALAPIAVEILKTIVGGL